MRVEDRAARARLETAVLPHLDAAYNLARWLTRDDHAPEDVRGMSAATPRITPVE